MEPPSSPILISIALFFTIYAFILESNAQHDANITPQFPPPPPPPPPPPTPPSPSPPNSPPPPDESPPPSPLSPALPTPPPPRRLHNRSSGNGSDKRRKAPPLPPSRRKQTRNSLNTGKKIGLWFAGIAGILQIAVVGFLVFKRKQILKMKDTYETCSS